MTIPGPLPGREWGWYGAGVARVVLALGSNLGDLEANLDAVVAEIRARVGELVACSARHVTAPVLHPETPTPDQGDYLNMAVVVESALAPRALLHACQAAEAAIGRERNRERVRWAPRVLDVDVIAIEAQVVDEEALSVPHPHMHERCFVLAPMLEVWPDWVHPRLKRDVASLLASVRAGT